MPCPGGSSSSAGSSSTRRSSSGPRWRRSGTGGVTGNLAARWGPGELQLPGRLAGRRVVRLPAQRRPALLVGHCHGLLGARSPDPRPGLAGLVGQLHRDRVQHAGQGDAPAPDAGLRVDDDGGRLPAAVLTPDHRGGPVHGHLRPAVRLAVLPAGGRRRPDPLAAPVLAVRPSRGLHPDPPRHGDRLRDPPRVLPQAALRLCGCGVRRRRHRFPRLRGVGPPHVRLGDHPGGPGGVRPGRR